MSTSGGPPPHHHEEGNNYLTHIPDDWFDSSSDEKPKIDVEVADASDNHEEGYCAADFLTTVVNQHHPSSDRNKNENDLDEREEPPSWPPSRNFCKKRFLLFLVTLIVLVAAGVGVGVGIASTSTSSGSSSNSQGGSGAEQDVDSPSDEDDTNGSTTSTPVNPVEIAKILPKNGDSFDYFGWSVGISGTTLAVGARRKNAWAGSVYVFDEISEGVWAQTTELRSSGELFAEFGTSLAVSSNIIAASAPEEDNVEFDDGSVHVFEKRDDGNWSRTANLVASDPRFRLGFGFSLAMDNGTIVVGTDDDDATAASVYVFQRVAGSWTETAKIAPNDRTGRFGRSVDISGSTIVVGAPLDDDQGTNAGAVYIFENILDDTWTQVAKLIPADVSANSWFGNAVSIDDDKIIVGAYQHNSGAGSAFLFEKVGGRWVETNKFTASVSAPDNQFGASVRITGSIIVIGSLQGDSGVLDAGNAYIYQILNSTWTETAVLAASDGEANDNFGSSLALSGTKVVVGAWKNRDNGEDSGSVYLFELL